MNEVVIGGLYRHFKGMLVKVLAEAKDSETLERKVVYIDLKDGEIWVRPVEMFGETIEKDGVKISRFELVNSSFEGK